MSPDWSVQKLNDICQLRPPKSEARATLSDGDPVSFVPMNDLPVREKRLRHTAEKPLGKVYGGYTYFADGDVLLAKITPCFENGKLGIARELKNAIGFGSSEFFVLRPGNRVDPEFLFYFLCQDTFLNSGKRVMSGAVGHKRVPKEFIEALPLPLPPLQEQKRIVAILDEAFAGIDTAIANTEKNIANCDALHVSLLRRALYKKDGSWLKKPFSACIKSLKAPRKLPKKMFKERGRFPVVSQEKRLINGRWDKQEDVLKVDSPVVIFGDHTRIFKYVDFDFVSGADGTKIFRPAEFLNPLFFFYYTRSISLKSLGYARHYRTLKDKEVRFPQDIALQKQIAQSLAAIESEMFQLAESYRKKIALLEELKQSLLQKAFSGELTADRAEREVESATG